MTEKLRKVFIRDLAMSPGLNFIGLDDLKKAFGDVCKHLAVFSAQSV